MGMSYASEAGDSQAMWQPQSAVDASRLPAGLYPLLVETGSLTERLRADCSDTFAVRVLQQSRCRPIEYPEHLLDPAGNQALLREVYLLCDGRPVVFAQTLVPEATLAAHPWLAELDDKPLGQALFVRGDVDRTPFEFAELSTRHDLAASAVAALDYEQIDVRRLWARRSQFMVAGFPVSVNEVFFIPVSSSAE